LTPATLGNELNMTDRKQEYIEIRNSKKNKLKPKLTEGKEQ
jgi:hypothetical protein